MRTMQKGEPDMAYDAQLRKQFKRAARISLAQAFWPAMGAVLLVMLPSFSCSPLSISGESPEIPDRL